MIKAIIFDIGGVVVYEIDNIIKKKLDKKFRNKFDKYSSLMDSGKLTLKQVENIYKKLTKKSLYSLYVNTAKKGDIDKNVKNLVFKLNKKYKVVYLSNTFKEHYLTRKKQGAYTGFLFGINSYKYKMRKPETRIFNLMLKKLNLKSYECVFIDDRKDNIQAAKKLKFNAILFKNYSKLIKDLRKLDIKV